MENPFRRNRKKHLNIVQEVGRDPLRIPRSTPISETIDTAQRLSVARRKLMTVLPQPTRIEYIPPTDSRDPDRVDTISNSATAEPTAINPDELVINTKIVRSTEE